MFILRVIVCIGIVGLLLAFGFIAADRSPFGNYDGVTFAQGNSGQNPMREMMRRMMRGLVPPPGMIPERLPDSGAQGAKLVARYCAQCHDLPSPQYKTADQWPTVFDRMLGRMEMMSGGGMMGRGMMGMGRMEAPTSSEARTLLRYLQEFAMREARSDELNAGNETDLRVFRVACSQCHVLPSPSLHSLQEWPAVVARMEGNIQLMNKRGITMEGRDAINRFLKTGAAK